MAASTATSIEALLRREEWATARALLEKELARQPNNHWLLTQLGVTYYEQERYQDALRFLQASLKIVADCPLTLWNLADALGKAGKAVAVYSWLLGSKKSPAEDACWESEEWTDSLRTDCVYRLGLCFEHLGRKVSAEHCFRQYINLLLAGMNGSYALEDAARRVRDFHGQGRRGRGKNVREMIESTLNDAGVRSFRGQRPTLAQLTSEELLAG